MDWVAERFARGACAASEPGVTGHQLPALRGRHRRLWIAGDARSPIRGWILGALEPSHEVAAAVRRATRS